MPNIFIIGNGFDLAHGINTSYGSFKTFLQKESSSSKQPHVKSLIEIITRSTTDKDSWSDFETALGKINYSLYQNNGKAQTNAVKLLKPFFKEWLVGIPLNEIQPIKKFRSLIDPHTDVFFTFNYTSTLENLYEAKYVCHIHGETAGNIIFGHGNNDLPLCSKTAQQLHISLRKDISIAVSNIAIFNNKYIFRKLTLHEQLRENRTTKNLLKQRAFLEQAKSSANTDMKCRSIFSIGFSYSEIDMVSIKHISEFGVESGVGQWILDDFDSKNLTKYKTKINTIFMGDIKSCTLL